MREKKEKSIQEIVSDSLNERREEIITNGINGIQESIKEQLQWKIGSEIGESINTLFEDEAVKAKLNEEIGKVKIALVESFATEFAGIVPTIATKLAEKLQERAIKNLTEDSYSMRDLYKKLFD